MTRPPPIGSPPIRSAVHDVVVAELRSILSSPGDRPTDVDGPAIDSGTRLEGDLQLESLDLLSLAQALRERYGEEVDLIGYVAGLSLDEIIELNVGAVVDHVLSSSPGAGGLS